MVLGLFFGSLDGSVMLTFCFCFSNANNLVVFFFKPLFSNLIHVVHVLSRLKKCKETLPFDCWLLWRDGFRQRIHLFEYYLLLNILSRSQQSGKELIIWHSYIYTRCTLRIDTLTYYVVQLLYLIFVPRMWSYTESLEVRSGSV